MDCVSAELHLVEGRRLEEKELSIKRQTVLLTDVKSTSDAEPVIGLNKAKDLVELPNLGSTNDEATG